jgi:hypothetical protein
LTPSEVTRKEFILEYDIIDDKYTRVSNNNETIKFWQKGACEFSNIMRKEEFDWKMVYLARTGKLRLICFHVSDIIFYIFSRGIPQGKNMLET